MSLPQMGPSHIANSRAHELQRTNNFALVVGDLGEDLTLAVDSFSAPDETNAPIEISYGNHKVKFAGPAEFSDGDMVVNDFIGIDTEKIITDWKATVYDPKTDKIGFAASDASNKGYKKTAYLYLYSPDGSVARKWKIEGCWPSHVAYGEFSNSSPDKRQITVTLTYDKAYRLATSTET